MELLSYACESDEHIFTGFENEFTWRAMYTPFVAAFATYVQL